MRTVSRLITVLVIAVGVYALATVTPLQAADESPPPCIDLLAAYSSDFKSDCTPFVSSAVLALDFPGSQLAQHASPPLASIVPVLHAPKLAQTQPALSPCLDLLAAYNSDFRSSCIALVTSAVLMLDFSVE